MYSTMTILWKTTQYGGIHLFAPLCNLVLTFYDRIIHCLCNEIAQRRSFALYRMDTCLLPQGLLSSLLYPSKSRSVSSFVLRFALLFGVNRFHIETLLSFLGDLLISVSITHVT